MNQTSPAPILGLYRDLWSLIGDYLTGNDVCKLLMTGNLALQSHLKAGVKRLSLEWKSTAFLDLASLYRPFREFPSHELVIKSLFAEQLAWKSSATLTMWSSKLTVLDLQFLGAVELILVLSPLTVHWPLLQVLRLSESPSKDTSKSPISVSFVGLPPELLELHITTSRTLECSPTDFSQLPSRLRSLKLDVLVKSNADKAVDGARLPRLATFNYSCISLSSALPNSVETLLLRVYAKTRTTITYELGILPEDLMSLSIHLEGLRSSPNEIKFGGLLGRSKFHTLDAPDVIISKEDLELLPPSLTCLRCSLPPLDFSKVPHHVLGALKGTKGESGLKLAIDKNSDLLGSLDSLTLDLSDLQPFSLPSSLTQLNCATVRTHCLPESLLHLRCIRLVLSSSGPYRCILPPQLRSFEMLSIESSQRYWKPIIDGLAPTLESIALQYLWESWNLLADRARSGALPNLTRLRLEGLVMPIGNLSMVPTTVTDLSVQVSVSEAICDQIPELDAFRRSNVEKLFISVSCPDLRPQMVEPWSTFLPHRCTDLDLHAMIIPARLELEWPPSLQRLVLASYTPVIRPLPGSIRILDLAKCPSLTAESLGLLPPYLSELTMPGSIDNSAYYLSRTAPPGTDFYAPYSATDERYCSRPYQ